MSLTALTPQGTHILADPPAGDGLDFSAEEKLPGVAAQKSALFMPRVRYADF
jgi:hypothetical protein